MMKRASELMLLRRPVPTGLERLDALIGGLRPGALHIFYGDRVVTDLVLYRLMVEASRHGWVAYLNNTDYYGEKTLIDATSLSTVSKMAGVEPLKVLSAIRCAAAFNARRQVCAAEELSEDIGKRGRVALIAMHNAPAFLDREGGEASSALVKSVSILMEAASRASAPLVVTAPSIEDSPDPARATPKLPAQIIHRAAVIVFFRPEGLGPSRQARQARFAACSAAGLPRILPLAGGLG